MDSLKNKKILLCVTGSIAAYKACEFIRLLRKQGCTVKVIMSASAKEFIGEITLSSLSNNTVMTDDNKSGLDHVNVAIDFDAVVVLPATANILCKAANGIADEIVSTVLSICEQPKLFVPAMNFRMWQSQATQKSVGLIKKEHSVMIPEEGELASLHKGEGRLPELHDVMNELRNIIKINTPLKNKKIIVTAGPTVENIDPVRFISNKSSGKMGYAIAEQARDMGAAVTLISGPVALTEPSEMDVVNINTASDMECAIRDNLDDIDIIIMCAAVSDFTPKNVSTKKMKSTENEIKLLLVPTNDIVKEIAKDTNALIVAFALETCAGINNAKNKLVDKNVDFIVLNHPNDDGCGIGSNFNKVTIIDKKNNIIDVPKNRKDRIAKSILEAILS